MKNIMGALLLCLSVQAFAGTVTVGGVGLDDKITVNRKALVLNGAGIRTKLIFDVYVGALYLSQKKNSPDDIFADQGPKRVELHILRHLAASDFMDAFNKAINANHTPEEYAPLAARLLRFGRSFREVGEVDKGSLIILDFVPETGMTVLTVNRKEITRIEGADFFNAMLKIWLGKNPVQDSLKKEMLGG
jgi:hypothetical protein